MTKDNYERSLSMPLGAEYNTLASFQSLTTPRVEAKVCSEFWSVMRFGAYDLGWYCY